MIPVSLAVTFKDLVTVDSVSGSIVAQVYIDMFWVDAFTQWDPALCDGFESMNIDESLVWTPDILLYNAVGSYDAMIDTPALFLYSDGTVWWSGKGMIVFSCTFDTTNFPFDEQNCTADFGSWIYTQYQMNISEVTVTTGDQFSNLAWRVSHLEAERREVVQWEVYDFSLASYTITIERYSAHYLQSAIIPSILVTCITLMALWVPDIHSRLGLSVTGLLTLITIQVGALPIHTHAFYFFSVYFI